MNNNKVTHENVHYWVTSISFLSQNNSIKKEGERKKKRNNIKDKSNGRIEKRWIPPKDRLACTNPDSIPPKNSSQEKSCRATLMVENDFTLRSEEARGETISIHGADMPYCTSISQLSRIFRE